MKRDRYYISYRRGGGERLAELLREGLLPENPESIFLAPGEADTGEEREKLQKEINACDFFLIALSANALEECSKPGDLFRMEIETAIAKKKTIVPVTEEEYVWPKTLPASIAGIRKLRLFPYLQINEEGLLVWPYTFLGRLEAGQNVVTPESRKQEEKRKESRPPARPEKRKSRNLLPVVVLAAVLLTAVLVFVLWRSSALPKENPFAGKTPSACGVAGEDAEWYFYDDGGLSVIGKGSIEDCTRDLSSLETNPPWGDEIHRSMTYVIIDPGITQIGSNVFCKCRDLKSVSIPASVRTIKAGAFLDCKSLERFEVDRANKFFCSRDGVLFSKDMSKLLYYPAEKADKEYSVPEGVTSIENCANAEFAAIHLPKSLKEIKASAFSECDRLKSIKLPSGIREIPDFLFWGCDVLETVSVPKSVTRISRDVLYLCPHLTELHYEGTMKEWSSISVDVANGSLEKVKIIYRSY